MSSAETRTAREYVRTRVLRRTYAAAHQCEQVAVSGDSLFLLLITCEVVVIMIR